MEKSHSNPESVGEILKRVMPELKLKYHKKYYDYLDDLRESGVVNMFGARPHLEREFKLAKQQASDILTDWMKTYSERHTQ